MGNAPRRKFLQRLSLLSASTLIGSLAPRTWAADLDTALTNAQSLSADQLASEEDFWYFIQQSFTVSSGLINLNNGGTTNKLSLITCRESIKCKILVIPS